MYDIIVIGGGPAGLSAAANASYRGLKTLVIERFDRVGGRPLHFYPDKVIKDHTGFPQGILSKELCRMLELQAVNAGAEIKCNVEALKITRKEADNIEISTTQGIFNAKRVIIGIGILSIPNKHAILNAYTGDGIYNKVENAEAFRNKKLVIIGGGDNAFDTAVQLSGIAEQISVVMNHEFPKAMQITVDDAKKKGVQIYYSHELIELGTNAEKNKIEKVKLLDMKTKEEKFIECNTIFSAIGFSPATTFLKANGIEINPDGTIITKKNLETNIEGVFAAGDISGEVNLITTACASGIKAAISTFSTIKKPYWI